ncbi:PilW family protein [Aneurinibacillus terranovensis]|uniref:PilW family protein n=1 Tax=Aneurinibacillus terranovensis TaxID=278991 RepID=UPI0004098FBF|nr:prepilin-type N-terminal cleavage/methylation domain-containing protein [Aneurinibacillus terranovensis]
MKNKAAYLRSFLPNQYGVTLIELLIATVIFLTIVLPLSTVYIQGMNEYKKTKIQTQLRNEADFLLSGIMKQVQESSYFELADDSMLSDQGLVTADDKETLLTIFSQTNLLTRNSPTAPSGTPADTDYHQGIISYKQTVAYDSSSGQPSSTLNRKIYTFNRGGSTDLFQGFDYDNAAYIAKGLFRVSDDNKKLYIYLVIAPHYDPGSASSNNQPMFIKGIQASYKNLAEIKAAIDASHHDFIHVVKTEISINNLGKG